MAAGGNESMWFNISPPRGKQPENVSDDDSSPLLKLKEFEKPPLVLFGQVTIGTTATAGLKIFNPNKVNLHLSLDKIPANFSVKNEAFNVQANGYVDLEVFWKPTALGGLRKSVMVNTDLGQRFQFYVQGECVQPCVSKAKKMSKNRSTSQPYSIKPKPRPLAETNIACPRFYDTDQDEPENIFNEIDAKNPLPLTPMRRETFYINPKRQVLSDMPVPYQTNTASIKQTINFDIEKEKTGQNGEARANIRKNWSPVGPVTTENLLHLPLANKDSLSSNETVSSNACSTFAKNPFRVNLNESDNLEDSLNEPYITAHSETESDVTKDCTLYKSCIDLKKSEETIANINAMYRLIQNRLQSSNIVSDSPVLPTSNRSNSFTVDKPRSHSDSSLVSLKSNEADYETCNRRVSTTKKESRTKNFDDLGLTHDLSRISSYTAVETSSSSSELTHDQSVTGPKRVLSQTFHGNETHRMRRSTSLNIRNANSPKNKNASISVISPRKRSATGRVQRSKPYTSFIKPVAQPKLNLFASSLAKIPRHPNMFAAKNVFYDEQWQQKEEKAFVRWLNHVFTPPDGFSVSEEKVKISETWVCSLQRSAVDKTIPVKVALDKETISLKMYTSERKKNILRRAAATLFHSEEMLNVLRKIEQQVSEKRICIREDRKLHADQGLKKCFLDLLLNYNVLWLHTGLEIVFGELIYLQKSNEVMGLSRFIVQKFLFSQEIAKQYAHKVVPNLYADGYEEELSKYILRKFLFLVLFLDKAKESHIIEHDPCLFNKNAKLKASKDILIAFSCGYLKGEGDITRHLSHIGYKVTWNQRPLEEFNYAVTNLSQDLKCGTRLARVCELLFHSWALTDKLRVPATTRIIKARNVESVLKVLRESGVDVPSNIKASDISDGHREHTLTLLWKIIYKTQVEPLICDQELRKEIIHLHRSSRFQQKVKSFEGGENPTDKITRESSIYNTDVSLYCLLRWCQIIGQMYGVQIENLSVSFSDGRAFCYIIHHYHPDILPKSEICDDTQINFRDRSHSFAEMSVQDQSRRLKNEKKNLKMAFDKMQELGCIPIITDIDDMCNTIPDEKVVVTLLTYLNARLTNLGREIRAARTIQLHWRKNRFEKMKKLLEMQNNAALTIQNAFRQYILKKRLKIQTKAATSIQRCFRSYRFRKGVFEAKTMRLRNKAAITIQAYARCFIVKKRLKKIKTAVVSLQAAYRGYVVRKAYILRKAEIQAKLQDKSAVTIQKHVRMWLERKRFIEIRERVIKLQSFCRGFLVREELRKKNQAALKIQCLYRAHLKCQKERDNYLKLRKSVICLQSAFRGSQVRRKLLKEQNAAIKIQAAFKGFKVRRELKEKQNAAIKIQSVFRGFKTRCELKKQRNSAVIIQAAFKGFKVRREVKMQKKAATKIQALFKGFKVRRELKKQQDAALKIQAAFRSFKVRQELKKQKTSAVKIQALFKGFIIRQNLKKQQRAAVKIQAAFRSFKAKRQFKKKQNAAVIIQSVFRGFVSRSQLKIQRIAATKIQSVFRGFKVRQALKRQQNAATIIQATFKGFKSRLELKKRQNAAVLIQSTFKSFQARRKFIKQKDAALKIQRAFRAFKDRRELKKRENAAVVIQAAFKGFKARRELKKQQYAAAKIQAAYKEFKIRRELKMREQAAIKIQRVFRGFRARHQLKKQQDAAMKIQSVFRGFRARCELKKRQNAAIKIQTAFRGYKTRLELKNKQNAAVKIQSIFRGFTVRRDLKKRQMAAVKIQAAYRGFAARSELQIRQNAAIKIQGAFRRFKARQKFKNKQTAATKIQSIFRGFMARSNLKKQQNAAIKIQSAFKGFRTRRDLKKKQNAATKIQSAFRGFKVRRDLKKRVNAAVKIQAIFRGFKARCELKKRVDAAVKIQSAFKGYKERCELKKKQKAALKIQSVFRGFVARSELKKRQNSAVKIQSAFKGFIVRRELNRRKDAAPKIQSLFRGFKVRRQLKNQIKAALKIQSLFRGLMVRMELKKKQKAALKIQSTFRGFRTRCELKKRQNAAKKIQSAFKRFKVRRELKKRDAATIIQSAFRGYKARLELKKQHYSATKIQSTYRGYVVRHRLQLQSNSAVTIQKHFRGWLERKRYIEIKRLVIRVQSLFRGFLVREELRKRNEAALKIQAFYIAHRKRQLERVNYLKTLKSIQIIQSHVRMWITRKRFSEVRSAVILIQARCRGYLVRKSYTKTKAAILFIQCKWKATLEMRRQRQIYLKVQSSVIVLQSAFRSWQVRRELKNKENAAVKIQAAYRGFKAQREFHKVKWAITTIQSKWRAKQNGLLHRKEFLTIKKSATLIQAYFRGYLTREIFKRQKASATVIKEKKAAVTIQRYWKGYILRKNIKDEKIVQIRNNLQNARRNASKSKTFGQLTREAVRVILSGRVTDVIQFLMHLEKASRFSKSCRKYMKDGDIMQSLLTLVRSCNRSLPHVDVLVCCCNIFLNLAMFDDTSDYLWSSNNLIDHCLELMKKFQDRDTIIMNKITTLLFLMCQDKAERLSALKNHPTAEKSIIKLYDTCSRKLSFKLKVTRAKDNHEGCACAVKSNKVRRRRTLLTQHRDEFETPLIALEHLTNLLKL